MALNLQVDQDLSAIAQSAKDQNGNTSPLALSIDKVGIGTTNPETKLDVSGGAITIRNTGEGAVLLFLGVERHWQLRQLGTGASTALELASVGGGGNKDFIISTDGQVGIGTANPTAKLEVQGEIRSNGSSGGVLSAFNPNNQQASVFLGWGDNVARIRVGGDGVGGQNGLDIQTRGNRSLMRLNHNGVIEVPGDIRLLGADCAENFDMADEQTLEPGTVMVIGDEERLYQCMEAYDKRVAGVISGAGDCKPGMILGNRQSQNMRMPVALTGKVYCKVDAQYASIAVGDLLTTSPSPGHAMKASDPLKAFGAVIGKALRPLTEGTGLIPILVALQ